jgi:hypothetical protein
MPDNKMTQEEALKKLHAFVVAQMKARFDKIIISQKLVEMGVDSGNATQLVDTIHSQVMKFAEEEQFTINSIVPALVGGIVAAALGGALWGLIAGFDITKAPDLLRRMGIEHRGIAKRNGRVLSEESPLPRKNAEREIVAKRDVPPVPVVQEVNIQSTPKQQGTVVEKAKSEGAKDGQVLASKAAPMLQVKRAGAKLYAQPGDYSTVIAKLQRGDILTQLSLSFGMEDTSYKVQTQKGKIGWVRDGDVEKKP